MSAPWWKTAVVYQIYPRSFLDTDGDGVGDLEGIRRKLDHLVWLGVDAVWLSPMFRSPMKDFGYDVADYCDVDPIFGTLADLDRLIADAHARGLKVLLDWVPNHTSDQHPWFAESRRSRTSPKRDWYYWRDPAPDGCPPNDWKAAFPAGTDAWTLDAATGQYYLHQFLPEQPDLNWENPDVVAALHGVLRFWLDRGVDGFRIDVAHGIGKDPALPDEKPEWRGIPHVAVNEQPSTHAHLRAIRRLADGYPGDRVLVGEIFQLFTQSHDRYFGTNDELPWPSTSRLATPWEAPHGATASRVSPSLDRSTPGPRGSSRTTTRHATAPASAPKQKREPPPSSSSRSAVPHSSTPARSSASKTPTSRWPIGSTPATATAAAPRSRGTRRQRTAGRRRIRGCPGRRTPAREAPIASAPTSARSSTSTAASWRRAAHRAHFGPAR
jgi:glycosidase